MTIRGYLMATAAVAMAAMATPALSAQATDQTASQSAANLDEVVVTGSRIRGVAPVGSPITSVGRDTIDTSAASTTSELLLNLPSVLTLGVSEASRASNGGSTNFTYAQGVNIHGIGPAATLLLLDGRRMTPQGAAGNINDVSLVPNIALERVEIVPDGASAIYGSDAIAGVANLILRRRFQGLEVTARYGGADSYHEGQFGLIAGKNWDSGYATFSYGYSGHGRLKATDRTFASTANLVSRGGSDFRSTQCNPGNIVVGGVSYAIPAGGVTPATAGALTAGTSNRCDIFSQADLLPEISRNSFVATLNQDITNSISFYATGLVTLRQVSNRVGLSTATLSVPNTNAFFVTPVPGTTKETVNYAFTELPTNDPASYGNFYQATAGLKFRLPHNWQADAAVTVGYAHDRYWRQHGFNIAALTAALASSDPATAFNPFGGANSPTVLAAIGNAVVSFEGKSDQEVADLNLDGPLFALPGGDVRLAVGYQHVSNLVNQYTITGIATAPVSTLGFGFRRNVDSAFAELLIPVVGSGNAMPGIRSLDIDVAARYDRYNDSGSTENPKVGVNWEPFEGAKLHASYGTSFRAPSLISAHSSALTSVMSYPDPLLGGANVNALQISGGNVGLKPETATTYSVGLDWAPPNVRGLSVSLNYWNVDYRDIVAGLANNAQILNQASFYAGLGIIERNPSAAEIAQVLAKYPLLAGVVPNPVTVLVDVRSRNLASIQADGIDLSANYTFATDRYGQFNLGFSGSYFLSYLSTAAPGQAAVNQLGVILNPVKFNARGTLGWRKDAWTLVGYLNYTSGYTNNLVTPVQKVSNYATVDLHVDYDLSGLFFAKSAKKLKVGLDVTNLFNSTPPFANVAPSSSAGTGYDATLASPIGRFVALNLSATF